MRLFLYGHAHLGNCFRELGQCQVYPVLDLHLGDIWVRIQGEINGQCQLAIGGGCGGHVNHVVNAVDLSLNGAATDSARVLESAPG